MKKCIQTPLAPAAIGTYSQAIKSNETIYLSGQIPLQAESMELVVGGIEEQIHQVFQNLSAVAGAANGTLDDFVKLNVYLVDLKHFPKVNEVMQKYFTEPYPARAAVGVSALPKGAEVEMDGVMVISE
ncbi:MAG: RidA family protein [Candidatus Oxydemutatoraceae bacterium WSBS_2016_MAG_OTU14]